MHQWQSWRNLPLGKNLCHEQKKKCRYTFLWLSSSSSFIFSALNLACASLSASFTSCCFSSSCLACNFSLKLFSTWLAQLSNSSLWLNDQASLAVDKVRSISTCVEWAISRRQSSRAADNRAWSETNQSWLKTCKQHSSPLLVQQISFAQVCAWQSHNFQYNVLHGKRQFMKYLSRSLSFDLSFDLFEQNTTEKLKKLKQTRIYSPVYALRYLDNLLSMR